MSKRMRISTPCKHQRPTRVDCLPLKAAINTLSSELLVHIFKIGARDCGNPDDSASSSLTFPSLPIFKLSAISCDPHCGYRFPLVVSHVCGHWRRVAISTPQLWTTINVCPTTFLPSVSLQLERSKTAPLDILIEWGDNCPGLQCSARSHQLYDRLLPHLNHWRSLNVTSIHPQCHNVEKLFTMMSQLDVRVAPQLKSLQLRQCTHESDEQYDHVSRSIFSGMLPALATLRLSRLPVKWYQAWISAASNLKHLDLSGPFQLEDIPSWDQFAAILHGTPELESLKLACFIPLVQPDVKLNSPIQLHKLTHFVLAWTPSYFTTLFLRNLYMPALKTLTLHCPDDEFTGSVGELANTVVIDGARPCSLASRLEHLHIDSIQLFDDKWHDVLEQLFAELHNIKSLTIPPAAASVDLPSAFLELLLPYTSPGQDDELVSLRVPQLESLCIRNAEKHIELVRKVIQTRKDAGVPIKALHLLRGPLDSLPDETSLVTVTKLSEEDVDWFEQHLEIFSSEVEIGTACPR